MILKNTETGPGRVEQVNMTPIIDIVFLLIIFFMMVCQFIVAENFQINVPDNCKFAQPKQDQSEEFVTVSILTSDDTGEPVYAVGAELIAANSPEQVVNALSKAVDARLESLPADNRIICVRADRDVIYRFAQYALAGIARSSATDIQLAALREQR